jgi:hypothetical protein
MIDTPIYVLTSQHTFSAAEEFTYNLKNLERATIIGETTGGGAHPVEGILSNLGGGRYADISIPFGRAINPITETNWEGTGVTPDIAVPASEALDVAQLEALEALSATEEDPQRKAAYLWARDGLKARLHPVVLGKGEAEAYVGTYGPRRITTGVDGGLVYQRDDGPLYRLVPTGKDRFGLEEIEYFRIEFVRDDTGKVVELIGHYSNGQRDGHRRSD